MKKVLYLISGLAWGIYFSNKDILLFAIIISIMTLIVEIIVEDKEL